MSAMCSLARAAHELAVTKATVSRRLAALESSLGVRLFERRPGGVVLTAAGKEAIATAEGIDTALGALEQRVTARTEKKPRGSVRLTAPHWLAGRLLIPALPELSQRYPELDVQLVGTNQIL